ncbi:MAG: PorP/SprF family type IX secretion system membrane protein [Bacteroidales bacterium]
MRKLFKYILNMYLLMFCITSSMYVSAQNDIQISYFMNNELAFNPSFAGNNDGIQASVLARKQWMGFDKAPETQTIHADYKSKIGGIGLYILNDGLGSEWSTHAKLLYAYRITLAEHTHLAAGIGGGLYNKQLNASEFVYQNPALDPAGIYTTENTIHPTLDVGIHISHKNLIAGLSSTHITSALHKGSIFKFPRHYYGYAQYEHTVSNNITIVPTLFIKNSGYISQVEGNCNIYFKNKYWVGASYRYHESAVFLAGIILQEKIRIGYAYDYSIGTLNNHSKGNHEIIASYTINPNKSNKTYYQSTRLFN